MRIVIAGQRSFGAAVLEEAHEEGFEVLAVTCPVHSPDGRDDRCRLATDRLGVPWISPGVFGADQIPEGTDLLVAAHSHSFIGRRTRAACRIGAIGYHPSLLPLHRGRDAVRWTVHMGDPVTGGTVYWLTDNVDAGPIAAQDYCFVRPDDTASSLWRRELFPMGVQLLTNTLRELSRGIAVAVEQDESLATWEPSWERPPLHRPELRQLGPAGGENARGLRWVTAAAP